MIRVLRLAPLLGLVSEFVPCHYYYYSGSYIGIWMSLWDTGRPREFTRSVYGSSEPAQDCRIVVGPSTSHWTSLIVQDRVPGESN